MTDITSGVLIVGAGPTGLTLALELAMLGTPFRIIDKAAVPSDKSRALVLQPRSLELLRRHHVDKLVTDRGVTAVGARMYVHKKPAVTVSLLSLGLDDTAFPRPVWLSQADTESSMTEHLAGAYGIHVERGTAAVELAQDAHGARATLRREDGATELLHCAYVVGCDGAHSAVRHAAGLSFEGAPYPVDFILCDARLDWTEAAADPDALRRLALFFSSRDLMVFFPMKDGIVRLIANEPQTGKAADDRPSLAVFQARFDGVAPGKGTLHSPVWLARFRLHHRIADNFRSGRFFVAGDAAHIHSPAGGQGMNTGIQDAVNLGWKLARALSLAAPASDGDPTTPPADAIERLLDSYNAERRPVGLKLLRGTDRIFGYASTRSWWFNLWRNFFVRWVLPVIFSSRRLTARLFRFGSELAIRYRRSAVCGTAKGFGGRLRGGDRAPDGQVETAGGAERYLMELCAGDSHHLLLFSGTGQGAAGEHDLEAAAGRIGDAVEATRLGRLPVHKIYPQASTDDTGLVDAHGRLHRAYGFDKAGYVLVRPDAYLAHIGPLADYEELLRWLEARY